MQIDKEVYKESNLSLLYMVNVNRLVYIFLYFHPLFISKHLLSTYNVPSIVLSIYGRSLNKIDFFFPCET